MGRGENSFSSSGETAPSLFFPLLFLWRKTWKNSVLQVAATLSRSSIFVNGLEHRIFDHKIVGKLVAQSSPVACTACCLEKWSFFSSSSSGPASTQRPLFINVCNIYCNRVCWKSNAWPLKFTKWGNQHIIWLQGRAYIVENADICIYQEIDFYIISISASIGLV